MGHDGKDEGINTKASHEQRGNQTFSSAKHQNSQSYENAGNAGNQEEEQPRTQRQPFVRHHGNGDPGNFSRVFYHRTEEQLEE